MVPYLAVISVVFISQVKLTKRSNRDITLGLLSLLLFLFAALRGSGDGDYFNYLRYSTYITNFTQVLDSRFPMEIGFRFISYLNNVLGGNPQIVIAAMNLISIGCVYKFIKQYSPDKILSVLVFLPLYLQYDMHASRTAVAMGIGLFSYRYLKERRFLKYVAIIALAACFHKSAWILLPIYFIGNLKINRIAGVASVLGLLVISQVISTSRLALNLLLLLRLNTFARYLEAYMGSSRFGYAFKLNDPRFFLVIGIYLLATKMLDNSDEDHNLLIIYTWVNALIMVFFREHTALVTRLSAFFNIFSILTVPYMVSYYKTKHLGTARTIKMAFIYAYILYAGALAIQKVHYVFYF